MFGMLGGAENMSENLSGCSYLPLAYHCIREWRREGADRTYLSQRQEASSPCASQCSSTQTAQLVVILTALPQLFLSMENHLLTLNN